MTPLEALAQNTKYRLEQDNIDCKYYKDFKNKSEKDSNMSSYNRLIICINSLPYTDEKIYDVVVIDEIETLLNKWFNNNTFKNNKIECWERFIDIIQKAKKVIFLDAFTSNMTIDFIKCFDISSHVIFELKENISNRTVKYSASFNNWLRDILNDLKASKKLFIFYPYLRSFKDKPSMEQLKSLLEKNTKKQGVCYNSQSDDSILKGLKNVNESWTKYDFVVTNTKNTVGINYELHDFDTVYLSIAGFSSVRDIIQVSYRCRHLISNNIKVCYIDKVNTYSAFNNDDQEVSNCKIYKTIVKNILVEKMAPLKEGFQMLCNMAKYKISSDDDYIDRSLNKYFKKLFEDVNVIYSYDTISDVDHKEIAKLEQKIYDFEATTDDKTIINKYYFKKQFETLDENILKDAWDNRFNFFFERVKQLKVNENNLFNTIRDFNKWSCVFPTDDQLNKVKLNNELIDRIFDEFHFRDLKKISKPKAIIKNIYNTFYQKNVIGSVTIDNKNYSLKIPDEIRLMFDYGMNHIKIHNVVQCDDSFINQFGYMIIEDDE
jgi:hypothetical protein